MFVILGWSLVCVVLIVVIGLLSGAGMRRDSDDLMQVEYLSQWSDLQRLRK